MENLPIVNEVIILAEKLEEGFNKQVKVGMSQAEVIEALEGINNFPLEELEHVVKNIFTWNKPLEKSSLNTLKNEYFTVVKRELLQVLKNQILVEDYSN